MNGQNGKPRDSEVPPRLEHQILEDEHQIQLVEDDDDENEEDTEEEDMDDDSSEIQLHVADEAAQLGEGDDSEEIQEVPGILVDIMIEFDPANTDDEGEELPLAEEQPSQDVGGSSGVDEQHQPGVAEDSSERSLDNVEQLSVVAEVLEQPPGEAENSPGVVEQPLGEAESSLRNVELSEESEHSSLIVEQTSRDARISAQPPGNVEDLSGASEQQSNVEDSSIEEQMSGNATDSLKLSEQPSGNSQLQLGAAKQSLGAVETGGKGHHSVQKQFEETKPLDQVQNEGCTSGSVENHPSQQELFEEGTEHSLDLEEEPRDVEKCLEELSENTNVLDQLQLGSKESSSQNSIELEEHSN